MTFLHVKFAGIPSIRATLQSGLSHDRKLNVLTASGGRHVRGIRVKLVWQRLRDEEYNPWLSLEEIK